MSIFEILMLVCFGLAWPLSIIKTLKSKTVSGKSPFFLVVVVIGYIAGTIHKLFYNLDYVIFLYILNGTMVFIDLMLYRYYSKKTQSSETGSKSTSK